MELIRNKSVAVGAEGDGQSRMERKGVKQSGGKWGESEWSKNIGEGEIKNSVE